MQSGFFHCSPHWSALVRVLVFTPLWPRAGYRFNTVGMIRGQYAWIPIGFQLGRWIARRARGREIASVFTFSVFGLAAGWTILNVIDIVRTGSAQQGVTSTVLKHLLFPIGFQLGCWMARRACGREIASVLAFALFSWLAGFIANGIIFRRTPTPSSFASHLLIDLPLLAGAIYIRRRNAAVVPLR